MKIVLATRNRGKVKEFKEMMRDLPIEIDDLSSYPSCPSFLENSMFYVENAREKAQIVAAHTGHWSLADDSGLEVQGLGWKPGVRSARYAGIYASDAANVQKMLRKLRRWEGDERKAVFRCALVLSDPVSCREFITIGELWGRILHRPLGQLGFGYDPIFNISNRHLSLAQMLPSEKNQISHRSRALQKMKKNIISKL